MVSVWATATANLQHVLGVGDAAEQLGDEGEQQFAVLDEHLRRRGGGCVCRRTVRAACW